MKTIVLLLIICLMTPAFALSKPTTQPRNVAFRDDGITLVDGKPFFPIAIWLYELNSHVMGDLHEHQFNTVIGNAIEPRHLDFIQQHGMMAVPMSTDEMIKAGKDHPALLAWYLVDEPETNHTPDDVKKSYEHLKAKDPNHPIGLTNYLFEALAKFKDGSDFTMTDVYPILWERDGLIHNVGVFVDEARRIHGPNWPHWCHIQIFGGKDTDGGKWEQPLPHEVRCMTFIALVHRATGISYFSYWPKAPLTWNSVTQLNKDLHRIEPWLLARGEERSAKAQDPIVQIRAKQVGDSWLIIAVNTGPKFVQTELNVRGLGDAKIEMAFERRDVQARDEKWTDRFGPFEERVYVVGQEPQVR